MTSFLYNIDSEIINKNQSKLDLQRVTIYVLSSIKGYENIVDEVSDAWNDFISIPERVKKCVLETG